MGRSIAAVVIGFIVIGVLAFGTDAVLRAAMPGAFTAGGGTNDPALLLGMLAYVTLYAVAGCYLAARLAPRRPMAHAMVLGLLGLVFNVAGTVKLWDTAPAWYHVTALLLVLPSAWLGGWLRERELGRGPARTSPSGVAA
jgi:hypothetical protein